MCAEYFLAKMEVQWDKGGRWMLVSNITGTGVVMLWPIRSQH